jgi:hypothetical protein
MARGDIRIFNSTLLSIATGRINLSHRLYWHPISNEVVAKVDDESPLLGNYVAPRSLRFAQEDTSSSWYPPIKYLDEDGDEVVFTKVPNMLQFVDTYFSFDPTNGENNSVTFNRFPSWQQRFNDGFIYQMILFDGESAGLPCIAFVDMTTDDGTTPWDLSTYRFSFSGSAVIITGEVS